MIDLVLRRGEGQPVHLQLRAQIAQMIRTGALEGGTRLPTVRSLALQVGLNRNTVQKAYGALERAGLVVTRVGDGTFVRARPIDTRPGISALKESLLVVIVDALGRGLTPGDLSSAFEAALRTTLRARQSRQKSLLESRRRFVARAPSRHTEP